MTKETTQDEINTILWGACDTFRGTVDPDHYKNYILTFLFLKYISDTWQDHYNKYKKQYGDNKERILRRMSRERFVLPEGTSFYDLKEKKDDTNLGEEINKALDKIETENKEKLAGVFRDIDFNSNINLGEVKDRNRRLKNLISDFDKLDLSPSKINADIIGNSYMYLIAKFASGAGKKAGEFFTPSQISTLLAKLAQPKAGDKICDPTCGSGSLLIKTAEEIENKGSENFALFGQESNGSTWALAKMNMFLHNKDGAQIKWGDTLNNPLLIKDDKLMKFDVVVANPPFSLDKWGNTDKKDNIIEDHYKRFWRGTPPKSKGDYAFISHMIETAKNRTGRVAVIVPHGVLFRGSSEGKIRQKLIEENLLDAVIGLPAGLFQTTGIPVAILIFDKSREEGGENETRKDVVFIDASREFESSTKQNTLRESDIEKIINTYENRKEIEKYSHIALFDKIKENDFNLNIPRYVDTFEEEEEIDIVETKKEIERLEKELGVVQGEMKGFLKELGL